MERWRLLSVLAALGLSVGSARANDPPRGVPGQIFYPHTQVVPVPETPPSMVGPSFYIPPQYPPLPFAAQTSRPIRVWMQKCGVGCWSHINTIGCGSLRADWEFIFGSCRTFFGEPCQHGPQSVPIGQPMPHPNVAPWGILTPLTHYGPTAPAAATTPRVRVVPEPVPVPEPVLP
jgi:hypothetical protein